MTEPRTLTDRIDEAVTRSATAAERIHREVAELPLDVLERLGLFDQTAGELRSLQASSIGAIYDLVRDVGHEVTKLAGDLLEGVERQQREETEPRREAADEVSPSA